ncbi:MAG: tetrahydromethanopterin S-methyltransferase subunit F [Methanosphaera stadtmanae]|nr:tetrahydromethanopterin S-methyltransferase subunit F [Methanosphaera stadtmanae]
MKNILNNIKKLTDSIEYKTQIIGRNQRLSSGVNNSRIGIIIGFIVTLIIVGIPIIFYKGGL